MAFSQNATPSQALRAAHGSFSTVRFCMCLPCKEL
jgi:hypothetical protein